MVPVVRCLPLCNLKPLSLSNWILPPFIFGAIGCNLAASVAFWMPFCTVLDDLIMRPPNLLKETLRTDDGQPQTRALALILFPALGFFGTCHLSLGAEPPLGPSNSERTSRTYASAHASTRTAYCSVYGGDGRRGRRAVRAIRGAGGTECSALHTLLGSFLSCATGVPHSAFSHVSTAVGPCMK